MRIKFLKDYGLKDGQGAGPHYKAGQEQTFTDPVGLGYARAYIERGLAVEVTENIAQKVQETVKEWMAPPAQAIGVKTQQSSQPLPPPPPVTKKPEAKIAEPVKAEPKETAKTEMKEITKPT